MLDLILMLHTVLSLIKKNPKFKVGDHVRISKHKKSFAKGCASNLLQSFCDQQN